MIATMIERSTSHADSDLTSYVAGRLMPLSGVVCSYFSATV